MESVELECGDISASQEELLARSSFLNGGDDDEVFSIPPTTQEDAITMCTLPFTQSQSQSPAPAPAPEPAAMPRTTPGCSSSEDDQDDEMSDIVKQRRRLGVCKRKVRGARIRTPTPSPDRITTEVEHRNDDPLYKAVLMFPQGIALLAFLSTWLRLLASEASSSLTLQQMDLLCQWSFNY